MNGNQRIAVAGATGRVGRYVADLLETEGHEVVAISRSRGVDLITGDRLADALAGVTTIVDAATGPSPDQKSATEFFTTATRNLQEVGQRAGVQRIVAVSIIGTESFRAGYIAGPREESLVEMARLLVARRGDPVLIEGARAADLYGVDVNELGALLPGPDATLAGPTFEDRLGEET
jgi:transposase